MKVIPSIDLSYGKAVKRVRGVRGSGLVVGDAVKTAENLYELGYDSLHIVDLDAAEGTGSNEDIIKAVTALGFRWVQVGGGVRDPAKAERLISYGASCVVVSTTFYENRRVFDEMLRSVGGERVLIAVDYDDDLTVRVRGWGGRSIDVHTALDHINAYDVLGVIFTYVGAEGTEGGVDARVKDFARRVKGLKEYAGGISKVGDLEFLKSVGVDYAIVGMAVYKGSLKGVKYV